MASKKTRKSTASEPKAAMDKQPRPKTKREPRPAPAAPAANERRKMDPIVKVSLVVFMLACLVVIGATVHDKVIAEKNAETVVYGDTVYVEYTGSLYDFYDKGGVIFDTNVKSVYDGEFKKAAGFERTSFEDLKVDVKENTNVLKDFRDAIIGKKVGDEIRIDIESENGYNVPGMENEFEAANPVEMPRVETNLNKDRLNEILADSLPSDFESSGTLKTVYGWDAFVTVNDKEYSLSHLAEKGEEYEYSDDLKISVVDVGGKISFKYVLTEEGQKNIDEKIGVQLTIGGKEVFAHEVDESGIKYRERPVNGQKLHFVIKIVSVGEKKN